MSTGRGMSSSVVARRDYQDIVHVLCTVAVIPIGPINCIVAEYTRSVSTLIQGSYSNRLQLNDNQCTLTRDISVFGSSDGRHEVRTYEKDDYVQSHRYHVTCVYKTDNYLPKVVHKVYGRVFDCDYSKDRYLVRLTSGQLEWLYLDGSSVIVVKRGAWPFDGSIFGNTDVDTLLHTDDNTFVLYSHSHKKLVNVNLLTRQVNWTVNDIGPDCRQFLDEMRILSLACPHTFFMLQQNIQQNTRFDVTLLSKINVANGKVTDSFVQGRFTQVVCVDDRYALMVKLDVNINVLASSLILIDTHNTHTFFGQKFVEQATVATGGRLFTKISYVPKTHRCYVSVGLYEVYELVLEPDTSCYFSSTAVPVVHLGK